jgi:hypothetical protein
VPSGTTAHGKRHIETISRTIVGGHRDEREREREIERERERERERDRERDREIEREIER